MSDCKHRHITTWMSEGEPAGLWSCMECNRKFVPLNVAIERERDEAVAALRSVVECCNEDWHVRSDLSRLYEICGIARAVLANIERESNGTE